MSIIFETKRLLLRQLKLEDYNDLCQILQDPITMKAYEHAFSNQEVIDWLNKQLNRYEKDGIGLWAVINKETNEFVGQVGLTLQNINDEIVPEVGYLLKREYCGNGYATEAALGSIDYGFNKLSYNRIFCIIRDNNYNSQMVAKRLGMNYAYTINRHYYNIDMPHLVYYLDKP